MADFEQAKFKVGQILVELGQERSSWGAIRSHFGTKRVKLG